MDFNYVPFEILLHFKRGGPKIHKAQKKHILIQAKERKRKVRTIKL